MNDLEQHTDIANEPREITLNDIAALKKIEPRKSVLNFTTEELASTSAFASVLNADIDKKSPYFRAENGEWRDSDEHTVQIIDVEDRKSDFKSVRNDIKSQTIMRGTAVNNDTGWTIQISRNGLEDTIKYAAKHRDTTIYNALYYIEDIVQNSVLLDTVTSEHNKGSKAFNTEFMHKMYSIFNFNGESYLAKLAVEEFPKNSADLSPMRRLYNLQDIKIEPLRHIEFREDSLARSILNGSDISIAHLFEIVKGVDKDFYINKKKTLVLNDGRESMDNKQREIKSISAEISITVSNQTGTYNTFDVTSVGFDTKKQYTVAEFNQALKKANEKWQENWDGLSYPSNIMIVTVENLHNDPCSYRINLTDDYNSIQDIVDLLPTPMHASISTEKAIEVLNKAEANTREQGIDTVKQDKTYAYDIGFTVVELDLGTEERKAAVSEALKNIIFNAFGERNDMSQPYKNLLEQIKPDTEFIHASEGHLSSLKYALRNAESNKELCISMLDSIKSAENSPEKTIIINGYDCLPKDAWEEHGVKFTIGQSVDDMSFYYARATDGKVTRDYEYDHEPSREKVISDHADKLAEEDIDRGEAAYSAGRYDANRYPKKGFEYNGYHFEPIGKIDSDITLKEIGKVIISNKDTLDMSVYKGSRLPYSYTGFYAAADKSKADIFRCVENGRLYIPGENELFEYKGKFTSLIEEKTAENIPQQQDISHKTTNADLSATRGERGIVMEQKQEARFEVSSLSKIEGEGKGKAIGTLIVNGEFAVNGVKVVDGLYAAMPSEKQKSTGEYKDVVFPVTKEAREAINSAVLGAYEKLAASPEKTLKFDVEKPEKAVSKVYAQMHKVESDKTQTKAAGQLTIAGCLVVTDVKLNEGTNTQGQTKNFVAMPSKPNEKGGYDDIAFPITSDFHKSVDKSVMAAVNNIGRYEYKGVKYAELGENPASSAPLHPKFADKLMAELDKAGIPYQAKCGEKIVISVPAEQKQAFEGVKKQLTEKLNAKDKPKQTQEQKQTTGTRSTH